MSVFHPVHHAQDADYVQPTVHEKLASIRGDRDYDKGWRHALQWVLETHPEQFDGSDA